MEDKNKNIIGNIIANAQLSDQQFAKLSDFITSRYGIKMPDTKKVMLQSRLHKRLRKLDMTDFDEYLEFVFGDEENSEEIIHMIDVVSTNKTDFFREPIHFEFMKSNILPELLNTKYSMSEVKVWSAGCSSGEEVYTVAITLEEFMAEHDVQFDYKLLATDISTDILKRAANAIYKEEKVFNIPIEIKQKYLLKSKDKAMKEVRIIKDLRQKVEFKRLNFMDNVYDIAEYYDIIFCRNVLIYFDKETQEKVINKLCSNLRHGGYFLLGHSESIIGMKVPLKQLKPTIFKRI